MRKGSVFAALKRALAYAGKSGFPWWFSRGIASTETHCLQVIQNEAVFEKAIKIAQIISRYFIVEKFIKGMFIAPLWLIAANGGILYAGGAQRRRRWNHKDCGAYQAKNEHPWRGEAYQKILHCGKISAGEMRIGSTKQGLDMESVLLKGTMARLHNKIILNAARTFTIKLMKFIRQCRAFPKISRLCDTPLVGLDFICQGHLPCRITGKNAPAWGQFLSIYIDMHCHPLTGQPRNVAGLIVDYMQGKEL